MKRLFVLILIVLILIVLLLTGCVDRSRDYLEDYIEVISHPNFNEVIPLKENSRNTELLYEFYEIRDDVRVDISHFDVSHSKEYAHLDFGYTNSIKSIDMRIYFKDLEQLNEFTHRVQLGNKDFMLLDISFDHSLMTDTGLILYYNAEDFVVKDK